MTLNIQHILTAHNLVLTQLPPVLEKLKDTTISLEERWDAFVLLVNKNIFVNEQSYGDGFLSEVFGNDKVSLYDDFNMDRGQTMTFPEVWESMLDMDEGETYEDPFKQSEWRERVLASGFSSFTHDW